MSTRKADQSEATRRALLATARSLFAERGFAATPTEEIVERAGVSRGALYYHFRGKRELFQAIFEEIQGEATQKVMAAATAHTDPWEQMRAGNDAFLDACRDPAVQRIVLLDGPSVLGWETWRAIEAKHGLGILQAVLQAAMDTGVIERQPVGPLAHLILGALSEAGMLVARAEDAEATRAEVSTVLARLLDGLRPRRA